MSVTLAAYDDCCPAKDAVGRLARIGFDMRQLSIVGKEACLAEAGLCPIAGLENLMGLFTVPECGPVMVAGALVAWIPEGLPERAEPGGLSTIGAGLYRFRISKTGVLQVEADLRKNRVLAIVHGASRETASAGRILSEAGAARITTYTELDFRRAMQAADPTSEHRRNIAARQIPRDSHTWHSHLRSAPV